MKKRIIVIGGILLSLFLVFNFFIQSKDSLLNNNIRPTKITLTITNSSIQKFQDLHKEIEDQKTIKKISQLLRKLDQSKTKVTKENGFVGANNYSLIFYNKKKELQRYNLYGSYLKIQSSGSASKMYKLSDQSTLTTFTELLDKIAKPA